MIQDFINKQFYYLYIFTLLFGVVLYDLIGFKSADEICALLLLIMFLFSVYKSKDWDFNKAFLFTIGVFFFYTYYSIYIGSNSLKAIITDLIIQMKPYLAFFAIYQLKPVFNKNQKKILQYLCLFIWFVLLPVGLIGFFDDLFIGKVMKHPTYYAASIVALSTTYLFCSNYTLKDKIIFLLMMSIGIASGRAKFYGFFTLAVVIILYFGKTSNIKLNFKNIFIFLCTLAGIFFVAWDKIQLYFVYGLTGEVEEDLIARYVLYSTSIEIFKDYMPFGSGLASFATHASGAFYSDIYIKYGISNVWGLSKSGWEFIADTYYPSLAQFGLAGVFFYILFWIYILKKAFIYFLKSKNAKYITIALLITGFIAIENVADATITSNRGFFMMILLGLTVVELRYLELQEKKSDNNEIEKNKQIEPSNE
nr:O-antigen ligase domain-containing protein [Parabacteroides goldsteinii]